MTTYVSKHRETKGTSAIALSEESLTTNALANCYEIEIKRAVGRSLTPTYETQTLKCDEYTYPEAEKRAKVLSRQGVQPTVRDIRTTLVPCDIPDEKKKK